MKEVLHLAIAACAVFAWAYLTRHSIDGAEIAQYHAIVRVPGTLTEGAR